MECVPQISQVEGLYPNVMVAGDGPLGGVILCVKCIYICKIYIHVYMYMFIYTFGLVRSPWHRTPQIL